VTSTSQVTSSRRSAHVVNHYDATMSLGLSDQDKAALVGYLKSL
jgi:hypothetical protein